MGRFVIINYKIKQSYSCLYRFRYTTVLFWFFLLIVIFNCINVRYSDAINTKKSNEEINDLVPYLITADLLLHKSARAKKKYTFIDIRKTDAYNGISMAGSMNIPIHAIKTKRYLKNKSIIIINEGYAYLPIVEECKKLTASGFKSVKILKGGLNAWLQAGGRLKGSGFSKQALQYIPPQAFSADDAVFNHNIMAIEFITKPVADFQQTIPGSSYLISNGQPEDMVDRINGLIKSKGLDPLLYVVIAAEKNEDYVWLLKHAGKKIKEVIFFLEGEISGYQTFSNYQKRIWHPQPKKQTSNTLCSPAN